MKKALAFIALLAAALVVALVVRLVQLRARGHGPGGTGVIEGVDVNVTSRIATRIARIDVREGDVVTQGQVVVELDCADQAAALDQAQAQLAAATATVEASRASAQSASHSAAAATASAGAAHAQLAALEAQERLAALELERSRSLVARDAVAPSELDSATSRHDTLVAQLAAQRAAIGASRDQAGALRDTGAASRSQSSAAERTVDGARAAVVRAELGWSRSARSSQASRYSLAARSSRSPTSPRRGPGSTCRTPSSRPPRPGARYGAGARARDRHARADPGHADPPRHAARRQVPAVHPVRADRRGRDPRARRARVRRIRGSLGVIGLAAFLYLFSSLGTGILIATLSASQQQAMLGAFAVILPAMLMSGFLSSISSMPGWLQPVTLANPMRHFLEILRCCLLKGATLADLAPQLIALAILGAALLTISALVFRRRLA